MRATDDAGAVLNAEFEVEPDGDHLALVMKSAGGKVGGSPHGRNHQYNAALELLLRRLRERGAVLDSGVVDSAAVKHLPVAQRTIIEAPVVLVTTPTGWLRTWRSPRTAARRRTRWFCCVRSSEIPLRR